MKGVIASAKPGKVPNPEIRNEFATDLRLIQVDFAVRDDRAPTGWVFGTFMYDGTTSEENVCHKYLLPPLLNKAR